MFDPNTKFRFTWPAFSEVGDEVGKGKEGKSGKRKEGKSGKGKVGKSKKGKEGKSGKEKGGKSKKGKEGKSKKGKGDGGPEQEDCGCVHLYPCRNWCAGVKACCLGCCEALGDCPRCACFQTRCLCGRLGLCLGGCVGGVLRVCGGVFSVVVALAGILCMVLMLLYLYQVIFEGEAEKRLK